MYASAVDRNRGLVVSVFSGPRNTDADYEAYVRTIEEMIVEAENFRTSIAILVVDAGNPVPNATWRRRIAEASAVVPPGVHFALVTQSVVVRGVLNAINWIRPPPYEVSVHATFEAAVSWCEAARGFPLPALAELLARARAGLATPRGLPPSLLMPLAVARPAPQPETKRPSALTLPPPPPSKPPSTGR